MAYVVSRQNKFSPKSELAGSLRPGRKLLCSISASWTSVLLQTYEQPGCVEQYETAASPDPLVVVVLKGSYEMESFSDNSWKRAQYSPHLGGVTAPLTTNRLRWRSTTAAEVVVMRLYIPQEYFFEASEEYRRAGERSSPGALDRLSLADPTVWSVLNSLGQAMARGAPDLYADAGARFLATHLLSQSEHWSEERRSRNVGSELTDHRLTRVLEFMRQHCASALTLDQLAKEAAISRFHFTRMFKAKLGVTPHRYIVQLRMRNAISLLRDTDLAIGEVAISCGYMNQSHFSASFVKDFHQSPSAFRAMRIDGPRQSSHLLDKEAAIPA